MRSAWATTTDYVCDAAKVKSTILIVNITGDAASINDVRAVVQASYKDAIKRELRIEQTEMLPVPKPAHEYTKVELTTRVHGLTDAIRQEMLGQCVTIRDPETSKWTTTTLLVKVIDT